MGGIQNSDDTTTYETPTSVPKYNLMTLDESIIASQIEYLLFVEHEEDMKEYLHLRPLVEELAKLAVGVADRAVEEFQREMTHKIASQLQDTIGENIAKVIYDARIPTTEGATVRTTIDDEKVLIQTVELDSAPKRTHHDW